MNAEELRNFNDLKNHMENFDTEYDYDMVKKAFEFCVNAHKGQKRASSEDYYYHPYNVAKIVVSLGMDTQSIVASI